MFVESSDYSSSGSSWNGWQRGYQQTFTPRRDTPLGDRSTRSALRRPSIFSESSNTSSSSSHSWLYRRPTLQQRNPLHQQRTATQQNTNFDPREFASARLLNEFPRLQNDTNPVLYEQIAADDKRVYEQDGLLWMRTNPTADPREVPLNYSTPYEVKLVAPGSQEQSSVAYLKISEVRNGSYCVRYIEHYNRTMPFWLGELHHASAIRSKGITPKPSRCGPATDVSYYTTEEPLSLPNPYVVRRPSDEPLPLYYAEEPPAYTNRSRPPSYRRKRSETEDHAEKVEESQPQSTFHSIRRHLRKSRVNFTNRIRPQSEHPVV